MNRKHTYIAAVFSSLFLITSAWASEPVIRWGPFADALNKYFEYPSPQNAKSAYQYLPKSGHVKMTGDKVVNDTLELFYSNFRILERQVISRDAEAVKLSFRLFSITDGAYAEELDILLGKLIRIDPKLFLGELVANRGSIGSLGGLLGNEGEEYVDRINAQCFENRQRKKALQSVSDQLLLKMRDECNHELERQWHAYCGANK